MEFTVLHFLWILPLCALTNQEMVHLTLTPRISTYCGADVTLQCNVSSSRPGLSIKHLEWAHSGKSLCSVNSSGNISYNLQRSTSDIHCEYKEGHLSLVLRKVQLEKDSGPSQSYGCKLQSNMGAPYRNTIVEIEECGTVESASMTKDGPTCTFSGVRPDGDVHWSTGSDDVPVNVSNQRTYKRVEREGWLTIRSYLLRTEGGLDGPYSCSLRSNTSGRYMARAWIPKDEVDKNHQHVHSPHNGVQSQGFLWNAVCLLVVLAVTLK